MTVRGRIIGWRSCQVEVPGYSRLPNLRYAVRTPLRQQTAPLSTNSTSRDEGPSGGDGGAAGRGRSASGTTLETPWDIALFSAADIARIGCLTVRAWRTSGRWDGGFRKSSRGRVSDVSARAGRFSSDSLRKVPVRRLHQGLVRASGRNASRRHGWTLPSLTPLPPASHGHSPAGNPTRQMEPTTPTPPKIPPLLLALAELRPAARRHGRVAVQGLRPHAALHEVRLGQVRRERRLRRHHRASRGKLRRHGRAEGHQGDRRWDQQGHRQARRRQRFPAEGRDRPG